MIMNYRTEVHKTFCGNTELIDLRDYECHLTDDYGNLIDIVPTHGSTEQEAIEAMQHATYNPWAKH